MLKAGTFIGEGAGPGQAWHIYILAELVVWSWIRPWLNSSLFRLKWTCIHKCNMYVISPNFLSFGILIHSKVFIAFFNPKKKKCLWIFQLSIPKTNGPSIDGQKMGIETVRGEFTIHCLDYNPYPHTGLSFHLRSDLV